VSAAKIIAVYMGPRRADRNNPMTAMAALELLQYHVELERKLDPGCPCDTLIVNNNAGFAEGDAYVASLHDTPTRRGRLWTHQRPNHGGGFGAYAAGYRLYPTYDHYMFVEDDVLVIADGWMAESIEFLHANPDVGFVALAPIVTAPPHCGGGCGLTSRDILRQVAALCGGDLPNDPNASGYPQLEASEIAFTNVYATLGYRLANLPGANPLAINYKAHCSLPAYEAMNHGRHVYQIGKR
jgi:hypothetical protein